MRRLASFLAVLVLLLGQAWASPTVRLAARPCCCKPGEAAHASVTRAKCCGQSQPDRAATQVVVRAAPHTDALSPAVLPSALPATVAPVASLSRRLVSARPPDHGIGSGLPYRLRV